MLGLLAQLGPLNGNALSRNADVLIGDYWTLTRSQVYRELQSLEQMTFVKAGPTGPRSSRDFSITENGTVALHDWLNTGPADEVIRMPILLTIRFGDRLEPAHLRHLLEEYRRRHNAKREFYKKLEDDVRTTPRDPFEIATIRFGELFESAVAQWLDELPTLLPAVFETSSTDE